LLSNGSSVRMSNISANPGAGIVIGQPDGTRAANGNTIDGSTISSNQAGIVLSPGASRNVITRNDIMWNRLGGVTVAPFRQETIPRENRLTANRYDENGVRPIVLNLAATDPNSLARAAGTCERIPNAANNGISPPIISSAQLIGDGGEHRVVIRGRACPGEVVEIYQSYVTAAVREKVLDMPRIRGERTQDRESMSTDRRQLALPSIGEFNYFGTTTTAGDGTFEATFPFHVVVSMARGEITDLETEGDLWARDILRGADATERAFSAVAIDAAGNTSEMSVRRQVDR
jgi:parallel beta-helix repeat protein